MFFFRYGGYYDNGLKHDDSGRFYYQDGDNMTHEFWQPGYSKQKARNNYCYYVHTSNTNMYILSCNTLGVGVCRSNAVSEYI